MTISVSGADHYSFTDWRMLEAENKEGFDKSLKALEPLQEYVIAFFDKHLKANKSTVLDKQHTASGISLQKYGNVR